MKSEKAKQTKKLKSKKKNILKTEKSDSEMISANYFRIINELEKQNSEKQFSSEISKRESKPKQKNITELIYSNNSKKLGNYYNKNRNDLLLYGSRKYDVLTMDKLLNEMGNYKSKVINKINENKNRNKSFSDIETIIENYEINHNKAILTPLAENEKERREMETIEKKKYDEAKRIGVVMRRIEYTYLLNNRKNKNSKNGENKELITKLKNSVNKIERCWLRHRNRKIVKMKNNSKIGHFEIEYISVNNNIQKLEELNKKCEELNKLYLLAKIEVNKLDSENKKLQLLLGENDKIKNKNEEFDNNNNCNDEVNEIETLNQKYNDLLIEKNTFKEKYYKLLEEKNILNEKYNEILEKLNEKNEELNNVKNEYEKILIQNNEKEEKIIKSIENEIKNNDGNNFENRNILLKDKLNNLNTDFENENKFNQKEDKDYKNENKELIINDDLNKIKNENENNKLEEEEIKKENEKNILNEEKNDKSNLN